mgnify:CR=1 FL=1
MIVEVIEMLQSSDYLGISKEVEFAKGKKKYVKTWSETKEKFKRAWPLRR